MFQSYNLITSLSARDNVALPARLARRTVSEEAVDLALARVGLSERSGYKPAALSGGQQQRVAIARVLALQPDIVFADEPTGALDTTAGDAVLQLLREAATDSRSVAVLADPDPPRTTMGPLRWVGAVAVLGVLVALLLSINGTPVERLEVPLWIIGPLVATLLVCLGPIVFPALLRGWTSLVPTRWSASWFLARSAALHSIGRSTAAVSPLMVAVALAGGLYSANGTVRAAEGTSASPSISIGTVVLLLGGPLLLSALGSAVTIFMSARVRDREAALVRATGGTPQVVVSTAAWEAVIYVVTAVLLGAVGVLAGAELLLVLVATVVPSVLGLRQDVAATLAAE